MSQETKTLRKVEWVNSWDEIRASNTDGYGTKVHLTDSPQLEGRTLCGKTFPQWKGYPSNWGNGICKRCLNKALKMGFEKDVLASLDWVESKSEN